jgi:hypothetical protein
MTSPASSSGPVVAPPAETRPPKVRFRQARSLCDPAILRRALLQSVVKLDPRHMIKWLPHREHPGRQHGDDSGRAGLLDGGHQVLGTNGGSFYGEGGAHPFENPAGFRNMWKLLLVIVLRSPSCSCSGGSPAGLGRRT